MMEVGLQEGNSLWPVVPRLTSSIEKAFASEDQVSRIHVTLSSGGEQDDDYDDGRSNIDKDEPLGEGCEVTSIQAVDDPNGN